MPHSIKSIQETLDAEGGADITSLLQVNGGQDAFQFLLGKVGSKQSGVSIGDLLKKAFDLLAKSGTAQQCSKLILELSGGEYPYIQKWVSQWAFMKFYQCAQSSSNFKLSDLLVDWSKASYGFHAIVTLVLNQTEISGYRQKLAGKTKRNEREEVKKVFCETLSKKIQAVFKSQDEDAVVKGLTELSLYLYEMQGLGEANPADTSAMSAEALTAHRAQVDAQVAKRKKTWNTVIVAGFNSNLKKKLQPLIEAFGVVSRINSASKHSKADNANLLVALHSSPVLMQRFVTTKPNEVSVALRDLVQGGNAYLPNAIRTICVIADLASLRKELFGTADDSIFAFAVQEKNLAVVQALARELVKNGVLPEGSQTSYFLNAEGQTVVSAVLGKIPLAQQLAFYQAGFEAAIRYVPRENLVVFFQNEFEVVLSNSQFSFEVIRYLQERVCQCLSRREDKVVVLGSEVLLQIFESNKASMTPGAAKVLISHAFATDDSQLLERVIKTVASQSFEDEKPMNTWLIGVDNFKKLRATISTLDKGDFIEQLKNTEVFQDLFDKDERNAILMNVYLTVDTRFEGVRALLQHEIAFEVVRDVFDKLQPAPGLLEALMNYVANHHDSRVFELLSDYRDRDERAKKYFNWVAAAYHFSIPKAGPVHEEFDQKRLQTHQAILGVLEKWGQPKDQLNEAMLHLATHVFTLDEWSLSKAQRESLASLREFIDFRHRFLQPSSGSTTATASRRGSVAEDVITSDNGAGKADEVKTKRLLLLIAMDCYPAAEKKAELAKWEKDDLKQITALVSTLPDLADLTAKVSVTIQLKTLIRRYQLESNHAAKQEVSEVLLTHLQNWVKAEVLGEGLKEAKTQFKLALHILKQDDSLWEEANKGANSQLRKCIAQLEKMISSKIVASVDKDTGEVEVDSAAEGFSLADKALALSTVGFQGHYENRLLAFCQSASSAAPDDAEDDVDTMVAPALHPSLLTALLSNPRAVYLRQTLLSENPVSSAQSVVAVFPVVGTLVHLPDHDLVQHVTLFHLVDKMQDLGIDLKAVKAIADSDTNLYFAHAPSFASMPITQCDVIRLFEFADLVTLIDQNKDKPERLGHILKGVQHWLDADQKQLLTLYISTLQFWHKVSKFNAKRADALVEIVLEDSDVQERFSKVLGSWLQRCNDKKPGKSAQVSPAVYSAQEFMEYVRFIMLQLGKHSDLMSAYLVVAGKDFSDELLEQLIRSQDPAVMPLLSNLQGEIATRPALSQLHTFMRLMTTIQKRLQQIAGDESKVSESEMCRRLLLKLASLINPNQVSAAAVESKSNDGGATKDFHEDQVFELLQLLQEISIDAEMSAELRSVADQGLKDLPVQEFSEQLKKVKLKPGRPQASIASLILMLRAEMRAEFDSHVNKSVGLGLIHDMAVHFPLAFNPMVELMSELPKELLFSKVSDLTMLHRAARDHNAPLVKRLLELCADDPGRQELIAMSGRYSYDSALYYAAKEELDPADIEACQKQREVIGHLLGQIFAESVSFADKVKLLSTPAQSEQVTQTIRRRVDGETVEEQETVELKGKNLFALPVVQQAISDAQAIRLIKQAALEENADFMALLLGLNADAASDRVKQHLVMAEAYLKLTQEDNLDESAVADVVKSLQKLLELDDEHSNTEATLMADMQLELMSYHAVLRAEADDSAGARPTDAITEACDQLLAQFAITPDNVKEVAENLREGQQPEALIRVVAQLGDLPLLRKMIEPIQEVINNRQENFFAGMSDSKDGDNILMSLDVGSAVLDAASSRRQGVRLTDGAKPNSGPDLNLLLQAAIKYVELRELHADYASRKGALRNEKSVAKQSFCKKFGHLLKQIVLPENPVANAKNQRAYTALASELFTFQHVETEEYNKVTHSNAKNPVMRPVVEELARLCRLDEAGIDAQVSEIGGWDMNKKIDKVILFLAQVAKQRPSSLAKVLSTQPGLAALHESFKKNNSLHSIIMPAVFAQCPQAVNDVLEETNQTLVKVAFDAGRAEEIIMCLKDNGVLFDALSSPGLGGDAPLLVRALNAEKRVLVIVIMMSLLRLPVDKQMKLLQPFLSVNSRHVRSERVTAYLSREDSIQAVRALIQFAARSPADQDLSPTLLEIGETLPEGEKLSLVRRELQDYVAVARALEVEAATSNPNQQLVGLLQAVVEATPQSSEDGEEKSLPYSKNVSTAYARLAWHLYNEELPVQMEELKTRFNRIEDAPYFNEIATLASKDIAAVKRLIQLSIAPPGQPDRPGLLALAREAVQGMGVLSNRDLPQQAAVAGMLLAMRDDSGSVYSAQVHNYFNGIHGNVPEAGIQPADSNRIALLAAMTRSMKEKSRLFNTKATPAFATLLDEFPMSDTVLKNQIDAMDTLSKFFHYQFVCYVASQHPTYFPQIIVREEAIAACSEALKDKGNANNVLKMVMDPQLGLEWSNRLNVLLKEPSVFNKFKPVDLLGALKYLLNHPMDNALDSIAGAANRMGRPPEVRKCYLLAKAAESFANDNEDLLSTIKSAFDEVYAKNWTSPVLVTTLPKAIASLEGNDGIVAQLKKVFPVKAGSVAAVSALSGGSNASAGAAANRTKSLSGLGQ